jgi:hypothetical protein
MSEKHNPESIQEAVLQERERCARLLEEAMDKSNNSLFRSGLKIGALLIRGVEEPAESTELPQAIPVEVVGVQPKAPTFSREDMMGMLPAVISDLKHHSDARRKAINNTNIRRDLYARVILVMGDKDHYGFDEPVGDGSGRQGLFIKGYVRDVWAYLENAYDLIHDTDFETEFAHLTNPSAQNT